MINAVTKVVSQTYADFELWSAFTKLMVIAVVSVTGFMAVKAGRLRIVFFHKKLDFGVIIFRFLAIRDHF